MEATFSKDTMHLATDWESLPQTGTLDREIHIQHWSVHRVQVPAHACATPEPHTGKPQPLFASPESRPTLPGSSERG